MADERGPRRSVLSPAAQPDILDILTWTLEHFGRDATLRYEDLIIQGIRDLEADAVRPGSKARGEILPGLRSYHLSLSR